MPKKKAGRLEAQITVRLSKDVYDRLEAAGPKLGLDQTSLARLIITENLIAYEERAAKATGHVGHGPPNGTDQH
jgi:hypothetical protein